MLANRGSEAGTSASLHEALRVHVHRHPHAAARGRGGVDLQGFLRALLAAAPPARGGVRVTVDVDPQSFM